jgi:hypothetical protein
MTVYPTGIVEMCDDEINKTEKRFYGDSKLLPIVGRFPNYL